ncbi:hypothetical protein [Litoreibacter arenae]|uniref:Uncharacterized protein n=1 Tax=Litoreibacter arenae DSM 19593 TaxID=1123360 RepID=S9RM91_9RHOB|nr:hypothetical protein [Litoreibacter arenae]EPX79225.1 hypothetical protein thalar_02050 [Litoreibacter arenae DSM 19593]
MNFETLDGTKLIILMIAGAVFAGVGLYLLLRPKPEGAAKIELFGLKFESSSAGLLVFLVGAAFLSLPLFVKEKTAVIMPIETAREDASSRSEQDERRSNPPPRAPVTIQEGGVVDEDEPNDDARVANAISYAQRVKGTVTKDQPDWFVMAVPDEGVVGSQLMLKHVNGYEVRVELYNTREEHVGWIKTSNGAKYLDVTTDLRDRIYLKVHTIYSVGNSSYELAVVPPG